jgi:hypothetical protein
MLVQHFGHIANEQRPIGQRYQLCTAYLQNPRHKFPRTEDAGHIKIILILAQHLDEALAASASAASEQWNTFFVEDNGILLDGKTVCIQ